MSIKNTNHIVEFESIEGSVPNKAGIYAWYSKLHISNVDLNEIKLYLEKSDISELDKRERLSSKLKTFIFDYFKEEDYTVKVSGQLKPFYEGVISHNNEPSKSLVNSIIEDPNRLYLLAKSLEGVSPYFSSPLYIGIAKNLNSRLSNHKNDIEELKENYNSDALLDLDNSSFAKRVVKRGFKTYNLFVCYTELSHLDDRFIELETTLNRINYPIFGRN